MVAIHPPARKMPTGEDCRQRRYRKATTEDLHLRRIPCRRPSPDHITPNHRIGCLTHTLDPTTTCGLRLQDTHIWRARQAKSCSSGLLRPTCKCLDHRRHSQQDPISMAMRRPCRRHPRTAVPIRLPRRKERQRAMWHQPVCHVNEPIFGRLPFSPQISQVKRAVVSRYGDADI